MSHCRAKIGRDFESGESPTKKLRMRVSSQHDCCELLQAVLSRASPGRMLFLLTLPDGVLAAVSVTSLRPVQCVLMWSEFGSQSQSVNVGILWTSQLCRCITATSLSVWKPDGNSTDRLG